MRSLRALIMAGERYRLTVAGLLGLGTTETQALSYLAVHGARGQSELARDLSLTSSAATALVDRLERHGAAERARHPTDRRRTTIRLTAHGEQLVADGQGPLLASLEQVDPAALPHLADWLDVIAGVAARPDDLRPAGAQRGAVTATVTSSPRWSVPGTRTERALVACRAAGDEDVVDVDQRRDRARARRVGRHPARARSSTAERQPSRTRARWVGCDATALKSPASSRGPVAGSADRSASCSPSQPEPPRRGRPGCTATTVSPRASPGRSTWHDQAWFASSDDRAAVLVTGNREKTAVPPAPAEGRRPVLR